MQVDIKTTDTKQIRKTFSFVARRLGADKPASRYQEATFDMQSEANFHYRPLWQPEFELYDRRRTQIAMADWYRFKDPRQYYYGIYTMTRAKQQEGAERQFDFIEKRQGLMNLPAPTKALIARVVVPLRHYEWGANMNNMQCTAYGFGAAITQATIFAAMDRLGLAQYLSRIGLMLEADGAQVLHSAKETWLNDPAWQGVRRELENVFVVSDWFEVFLAQNLVFDGLLYPLIYRHLEVQMGAGAQNLSMLFEFSNDWFEEVTRWVDATIKTASEESAANATCLSAWYRTWRERWATALQPLVHAAWGESAAANALPALIAALDQRVQKLGLQP